MGPMPELLWLTSHADAALDLLSDVILHPAFHPDDLERIRKQRMVRINRRRIRRRLWRSGWG